MRFFIDTANIDEIKEANELGVICGVTTNPSLIAKEGRVFEEVIKEITDIVDGPISAEVISLEVNPEEKEAHVVVPFHQLSLAIGKEGQNARLAARLTGYKIDIKSDEQ